jgi:hypothetical protein
VRCPSIENERLTGRVTRRCRDRNRHRKRRRVPATAHHRACDP